MVASSYTNAIFIFFAGASSAAGMLSVLGVFQLQAFMHRSRLPLPAICCSRHPTLAFGLLQLHMPFAMPLDMVPVQTLLHSAKARQKCKGVWIV